MTKLLSNIFLAMLIFSATCFFSCRKDDPYQSPPIDGKPSIQRIAPSQSSALKKPTETVELKYQLADNECLISFQLYERVLTNVKYVDTTFVVNGVVRDSFVVHADTLSTSVYLTEEIDSTLATINLIYTVPLTDTLARVELLGIVQDCSGKSDTTMFIVSVDYERNDPAEQFFDILDYGADGHDTIYNKRSVGSRSAFDLIQRQYANNVAAQDIRENTSNPLLFNKTFISPNNGSEPAFVIVQSNEFNYIDLTYTTMRQAFLSRIPMQETTELQVGDIVILKMSLINPNYNNWNNFAAIRILEIIEDDNTANDYIVFEYKRSENK